MKKIAMLLCFALIFGVFTGCESEDAYVPTGNGLADAVVETEETAPTAPGGLAAEEEIFSFAYYPEDGFNPYLCVGLTNRMFFSLLYQGLFTVDRNNNVEPMLCKSYTMSDDMKTFTFRLEEAVYSDGSYLTAEDVVVSLKTAQESDYYGGRLEHIVSIESLSASTVTLVSDCAYENLPLLLDIPILKKDQQTDTRPLGTGPYKFTGMGDSEQLTRREDWWCKSDLTVTAPVIELIEAESLYQIRDEFQFGDLDLVQAEPGSDKYVEYLCDYELWNSENGIFMYLVCHEDSYIFDTPEMRAALTYAIDRKLLAKEYYRGFATPATLPASPEFPYYNQTLASNYEYDPERFAQIVSQNGKSGLELTLVVCREDTLRFRVAKEIAKMLEAAGFVVRVNDYDEENIEYALVATEYDIYLGQTMLSPNMDLSEFYDDDGNLSYAGLSDPTMYALALQALENHGNYYTLHYNTMKDGHMCPLLFRSYAVYAARGLLTDLTPARNNVFYYSIGKSMEEARYEMD